MKTSLISAVFFLAALSGIAASGPEQNIFESSVCTTPESPINKLVYRKLSKLGIHPSICSDAVFVRRAFLDVIGTLPTAKEAREFIQDQDRNKRSALVDRLLEREEFADYRAMKWGDLLRVKAEFPINLWPNAAQVYHHWIRTSIRDNKPYDQFVREMLTANGSNFRVGQVNFYRAMQNKTPEGIATTVALTFMGSRAEFWPKNYLSGMAVFFAQISYKPTREWKEEIVFWDPNKEDLARITNSVSQQVANAVAQGAVTKSVRSVPQAAIFPDGTKVKKLPPDRDPREVFADWLITPKNAWFTANIVNRIWSWFFGRGIIHEPDDIRPNNPPINPALLAYLQKEFVANHYDMKHICRLILNSRTYQLSSIIPKPDVPQGEANFAFYPLRRLDAEVLIDAINQITGTSDLYTSAIPEPFTFIPDNKPAIALPDGSITSPFLDLFGHPARVTGMENERVNRPSPTQRMHMLNSSHIQRKLEEGPKLKAIISSKRKSQEIMDDLYLTVLSRFPTADEVKNAEAYAKSGVVKGREAWIDLVWALINSDEFLYRH
ncbi:MAG: DUF1549 and DUF1553 domain-containing protein [Verrucomicrobia bacterium]|nr:DUF1549 and DUF1553 domain-containing protein [Verrucomicrobiota bacterium]MBU1736424.1 DUF1549 and DUF1553 domain-containing protein [Verrucomicrobiota bacterium]MBU1855719.1 DUF1549 and DUF1553 domain-containing protein [Verrucomicrobiota bacterium]